MTAQRDWVEFWAERGKMAGSGGRGSGGGEEGRRLTVELE
jgi:hypothetical protein